MATSRHEKISHVIRRLGMGARAGVAASTDSIEEAISASIDLSAPPMTPPEIPSPPSRETAEEGAADMLRFVVEAMVTNARPIEERLVWFWSDHFATNGRKVKNPYLMWRQHLAIRSLATSSFAELLHAMATDPAMLLYLDGASSTSEHPNENFGREVMELYTVGPGEFTEADVIAASLAFTGWIVAAPGRRSDFLTARFGVQPWESVLIPGRHDDTDKVLLGIRGRHDASDAIDILLDHPATAEHIATKLHRELVGFDPDAATTSALGDVFREKYEIMDLVGSIVDGPAFTSDAAVRSRVRSPLERAIGIIQGFGIGRAGGAALWRALRTSQYVPFQPPNPAGFPEGMALVDPHRLVHAFDFAASIPRSDAPVSTGEVMGRLGIYDVSARTRDVLDTAPDSATRIALAINAPEYHVT